MLTDNELKTVNETIEMIYAATNMRELRISFLKNLSHLINFSFSDFSIGFINSDDGPKLIDPVVISKYDKEFEKRFMYLYETKFYKLDYLKWVFMTPDSLVYRESDLISEEVRNKSLFYQDYLKAFDLIHVAGIVIANNETFLGTATFYKSAQGGDFDHRDMYILELFVPHLKRKFENERRKGLGKEGNSPFLLKYGYQLTNREIEIMGLLLYGYSNGEIGLRLKIATNTVKKHISNIYSKLDVENRPQLVRFIILRGLVHFWEAP